MKLLVFGPGVIGTLFATRLAAAGHEVTVFARGARLEAIAASGLRIESAKGDAQHEGANVISAFGSERFDWILATIRGDQVRAALPTLAEQECSDNVMILANQAGDLSEWSNAIGGDRLALGFPGAGGFFDEEGVLHYQLSPRLIQPTTLGEWNAPASPRLGSLKSVLESAGFPTVTEDHMEAWLTTHAAWISVMALLSPASGYSGSRLHADRALRRRAIRATSEALGAVQAAGYETTPAVISRVFGLPTALLAALLSRVSLHKTMRQVLEDRGVGRRAEAEFLAASVLKLAASTQHPMPNYTALAAGLGVTD